MNTITSWGGKRVKFPNFSDFMKEVDTLRNKEERGAGFVCYFDNKGGSHVCEFLFCQGGVACCGMWIDLEGKDTHDCTGKNFSHYVYEAAGEIVKTERWDEFEGWSR